MEPGRRREASVGNEDETIEYEDIPRVAQPMNQVQTGCGYDKTKHNNNVGINNRQDNGEIASSKVHA